MMKNDDKTSKEAVKPAMLPKRKPPVNGVKFSSEYQPAKNGRKKKLETVLKELGREVSPEVEAQIYKVMLDAICCNSIDDATRRFKKAEEEQPEFGLIFEEVILAIKKNGLDAIILVLDRVFGKKNHIDLTSGGNTIAPVALVKFMEGKDDGSTSKTAEKPDKKQD